MYIVEHILGNMQDAAWQDALATARVDVLDLNQWDAQKNRLRRDTRQGRSMAVSLERGSFLHNGDVLWWDKDTREAVVCCIRLCDVMVIDVQGLKCLPPAAMVERCIALGHALGNQHWPAVVQGEQIFVPLAVDKKVMDSVMHTHHVDGIRYSFVPGEKIADTLAPAQVRRLFGGSEQPSDAHTHGYTHTHAQQNAHDHVHDHNHGHEHHHGHDHGHEHQEAEAPYNHGYHHGREHTRQDTHAHAHSNIASATSKATEPRGHAHQDAKKDSLHTPHVRHTSHTVHAPSHASSHTSHAAHPTHTAGAADVDTAATGSAVASHRGKHDAHDGKKTATTHSVHTYGNAHPAQAAPSLKGMALEPLLSSAEISALIKGEEVVPLLREEDTVCEAASPLENEDLSFEGKQL